MPQVVATHPFKQDSLYPSIHLQFHSGCNQTATLFGLVYPKILQNLVSLLHVCAYANQDLPIDTLFPSPSANLSSEHF